MHASFKSLDGYKNLSKWEQDSTGQPDSKDAPYRSPEGDQEISAGIDSQILGCGSPGKYKPDNIVLWNFDEKNKKVHEEKTYDPFEKVVLVKGIDNSILTSYRTLKGDNNTVSDTN